ncbi:MAG: hypothetical protein AMXMBFR7_25690 [Planctomycetota bacterium]
MNSELERNTQAYRDMVLALFVRHPWEYVVLHRGEQAGIYPDKASAQAAAARLPGALAKQIVKASKTWKGRPVFTEEDRKHMDCPYEPYPEASRVS